MDKAIPYDELLKNYFELQAKYQNLEKALEESNTRALEFAIAQRSAILDNLPFISWVKDVKGCFQYVNYQYSRRIYKSSEEIIGKTDFDLYPKDKANQYTRDDKLVLSSKSKQEFQEEVSGSLYKTIKAPIFSPDGEVLGIVGYQRNITLENKALDKLRKEKDFLQALLDNIPYTIYFKDTECRFTRINKAQAKVIGIDHPDDAIGKTDLDFFSDEHAKQAMEDEKKILRTGKALIEKTEKLVNAQGQVRWVSATKHPIKNREGEVIGLVGMSVDITEKRKQELLLREAKEKAEESDKLKTAFLANMSHEIRTPMNGIIGFTNLLKSPGLEEDERIEFIDHISSCGESLLALIDDIIDISKIEAGQIKIKEEDCEVNAILDKTYASFDKFRKKEDKEHIEIRLKKEIDEDFYLYTDPNRLRQILTNLIGNAIKFTQEGYIELGYTIVNATTVQFYVQDTGVGIPKEKQELIFERFGQVTDTSRINPKGTGLGLAISINLVRLLNGRMWVDSTPNEGATFYFTLPLKTSNSILQDQEDGVVSWANKTILIAEDEEDNFVYIKEILQNTKVKLLWAKNGKEALNACKTHPGINLVLMDLKMPVMDGYEATKEIRKFREHIPIIAQTAYNWPNQNQSSLKAGCNDYISKPINKQLLLSTLKTYMGEYQ